jgi:hypothetical protein
MRPFHAIRSAILAVRRQAAAIAGQTSLTVAPAVWWTGEDEPHPQLRDYCRPSSPAPAGDPAPTRRLAEDATESRGASEPPAGGRVSSAGSRRAA